MLIIKAYINEKLIDEIHIQNVGGNPKGLSEYAVKKPEMEGRIKHHRPDGWVALAAAVLGILAESGYEGSRKNSTKE